MYWLCRIVIEAAFFIAALLTVEKYLKPISLLCFGLAVLLSVVPFTLTITMLDLIIGFPELGFNGDTVTAPDGKGRAFVLEVLYLLDNHIFLSGLLVLPRLLLALSGVASEADSTPQRGHEGVGAEVVAVQDAVVPTAALTFFDSLEPALDGHICSMEAQEHYILITTTKESRMVLHRFSDAVRQTPLSLGMRVHRSHWVAHSAVQEMLVEGQSMKLRLSDSQWVPVSRTFRAAAEERYAAQTATSVD